MVGYPTSKLDGKVTVSTCPISLFLLKEKPDAKVQLLFF